MFRFQIPQSSKIHDESEKAVLSKEESIRKKGLPPSQDLVFEIHGSQFENRAPDRATRKFKPKHLKDL